MPCGAGGDIHMSSDEEMHNCLLLGQVGYLPLGKTVRHDKRAAQDRKYKSFRFPHLLALIFLPSVLLVLAN